MAKAYEYRNHLEWLGYVQPVGLVVSIPALLNAQCQLNQNMVPIHNRFMSCLPQTDDDVEPVIPDFSIFAQNVLDWRDTDILPFPTDELPEAMRPLEIVLDTYNEVLRPTHVVPNHHHDEDESPWIMLIQELAAGTPFDELPDEAGRNWHASPHMKFERLLRESEVPFGMITNGHAIRLVYAPKGESSGYLTFLVEQMTTVAGRPMFAALHMLLEASRLFNVPKQHRLPAILTNSRKYQNEVSTQLAEQVMSALFDLLRGFQSADDQTDGQLLREVLSHNPQHIYNGLLNTLMRTVFVLFAEDRDLISNHEIYTENYSIAGLFERLRADHGRYPDTMDQRYGAWAQLLTLFRLIHEGGKHGEFEILPRHGYLFDPDRYPFLEGRYDDGDTSVVSPEEQESNIQVPRVSDGVIFRVLQNLLVLDGERLSYRTLDVEQIGSVYEAIMGFEIELSQGRSIAIKPAKRHGAPSTINLEALLATEPNKRAKMLKEWSDQKLGTADARAMKEADTIEALLAALAKKIAKHVTPNVVPKDSMVFQPSDERRRSGAHYTPRSLTEPIVRTTLQPILDQLIRLPRTDTNTESCEELDPASDDSASVRLYAAEERAEYDGQTIPMVGEQAVVQPRPIPAELRARLTQGEIEARERLEQKRADNYNAAIRIGTAHPSQILDLKICDPAMGSGAFLVEACRQLGDELIKAWYAHDAVPTDIPPDEDEVLYARRLIAQRCLYGVDKNVMAVDLAKLSLWLVTLAKDHAFTFLDHALRHGDSLVGLTREQIIGFHWEVKKQKKFGEDLIQRRLDRATEARAKILNAREDVPYRDQAARMASSDEALDLIRLVGDACVSGFFAGQKKKEREEHAERLFGVASSYLESLTAGRGKQVDFESRRVLREAAARLRAGSHPIPAFHWEIEFPEVFARENGGFDAFVGNPPFLGGRRITELYGKTFNEWLSVIHTKAPGGADLVAHFFRRAFANSRRGGTFGFIATNSIAQGDTRTAGLTPIRKNSGTIYKATKRLKWPGEAAVIVSVLHICKGPVKGPCVLNGNEVDLITAYLLRLGPDDDPNKLSASKSLAFQGDNILGLGFTFDDTEDEANTLAEMESLTESDPRNADRIYPYIDGSVLNSSPTHEAERFVICFAEMSEAEARQWPNLFEIIERRVKPFRLTKDGEKYPRMVEEWWKFWNYREELYKRLAHLKRTIVIARVSDTFAFTMLPTRTIFHEKLVVFPFDDFDLFSHLQSRVHETWARAFSSSLKDDLQYTPTKCTVTFPFAELNEEMKQSGESYFTFRQQLMAKNEEGLTDIFNRMHDEHEQSEGILELRRLHGLMDAAVLRAYGWDDLAESARCEFLLDYEEEEDENESGRRSRRRKPWRYRWPDEFRDEVLARLLELNEQRHQEEQLTGGAEATPAKPTEPINPNEGGSAGPAQNELF